LSDWPVRCVYTHLQTDRQTEAQSDKNTISANTVHSLGGGNKGANKIKKNLRPLGRDHISD